MKTKFQNEKCHNLISTFSQILRHLLKQEELTSMNQNFSRFWTTWVQKFLIIKHYNQIIFASWNHFYLVPNSASKNASRCFGCRCNILQISVKLTNDVFFVPTLTTCGGFMTNFRLPPSIRLGFFDRIISKTRFSSWNTVQKWCSCKIESVS